MLLGELITVRLHRLPVKIVLFNNASLGMVKLEMMVDGIPDFETDHEPTNFAAIAQGAGIPAMRVEDPRDVRSTLEKGLAEPGPVLMEFVTDPNALSIPPAITGEQIRGFATSATKMVLGGGVGRMVDLARSNLRNIPRP
jgi:pyruvate dehydrogenase (quinone)